MRTGRGRWPVAGWSSAVAERSVADLIPLAIRRGGWVRGMRRAEAVVAWPRVVGPEVARFATAVAFQHGTLVVEVADAETAMHLGLQREHVLRAYRRRLPELQVRDVRFRVGRVAPPPPPEAPPAPEPDPDEVAALTDGGRDLPAAVAAHAAAAGHALATLRARRRAGGWRPCEVCGCLTEPPQDAATTTVRCRVCRRHAATPKVVDAAARLVVAPGASTPALTDDERRVARWLAEGRARVLIADLLPRALADPDARDALELAVRCAVALRRGADLASITDVGDVDAARDGIDPRALRALGGPVRRRPAPEVP